MKKKLLFGLMAVLLAWVWFGGISMASKQGFVNCNYENAIVYLWVWCYDSLDDAIEAASAGDTITLKKNIESNHQITINKAITLDWANYTLTVTHDNSTKENWWWLLISADGVTVENLTVVGPNGTKNWISNQHALKVYGASDVTLNNVSVDNWSEAMHFNNSSVKLEWNITVGGNCLYAGFEAKNSTVDVTEATIEKEVWIWDNDWKTSTVNGGAQWAQQFKDDTEAEIQWWQNKSFSVITKDWDTVLENINVEYWNSIALTTPSNKSCYRFNWWDPEIPSTMPANDLTLTAKWTYICGGGWSSSSSSNKTPTTTWTVETGTVDTWVDNNTTWENTRYEEWNQQEVLKNGFTREFNNAYNFAYLNWITTMKNISKADMNWNLSRIAMAKMLSQYAINVLGKTPDTTKKCEFKDVTSKMDKDYNDWVTLACQLGIMWMNMWDNFRPNDTVVRAEFGTALSRMLFQISDGTNKYYTTHLSKLKKEWIITNDDPDLQESRWYVMLMLMRSAK